MSDEYLPPVVVTRIGQSHSIGHAGTHELAAVCHAVDSDLVLSQGLEADAGNAAGSTHKAGVHHFIGHAQALKDLGALVAGNGADTHLGHHLEYSSIQSLHMAWTLASTRAFASDITACAQRGHRLTCLSVEA